MSQTLHLEHRPHPHRRQLYVRGRNMTVAQLVRTVRANGYASVEVAAEDLDLPVAAITEAQEYYASHPDVIAHDDEWERMTV